MKTEAATRDTFNFFPSPKVEAFFYWAFFVGSIYYLLVWYISLVAGSQPAVDMIVDVTPQYLTLVAAFSAYFACFFALYVVLRPAGLLFGMFLPVSVGLFTRSHPWAYITFDGLAYYGFILFVPLVPVSMLAGGYVQSIREGTTPSPFYSPSAEVPAETNGTKPLWKLQLEEYSAVFIAVPVMLVSALAYAIWAEIPAALIIPASLAVFCAVLLIFRLAWNSAVVVPALFLTVMLAQFLVLGSNYGYLTVTTTFWAFVGLLVLLAVSITLVVGLARNSSLNRKSKVHLLAYSAPSLIFSALVTIQVALVF